MAVKPNIRSLAADEFAQWLAAQQQPSFRASQVEQWLWQKQVKSFDEMTNLPENLRGLLSEHYRIDSLRVAEQQMSEDGTVKCAFLLADAMVVEGVLIPTSDRLTACISSQVGCSLTCAFCATGKLKRMRNLAPDEIFDQVVELKRVASENHGRPLTNIVFMGMGEPLLNYQHVVTAAQRINADMGLGMAAKRITISTAGIAKMIVRLADDRHRFRLALSLHAANDEKRSKIMPINDQNNLDSLAHAMLHFANTTGNRLSFEYIIFKDFNDEPADALELVAYCKRVPARVNIIEYNPIADGGFQQADASKVDAFARILESNGVVCSIRRSRGKDIDAACGQLANKNEIARHERK